jgi:hypothetical protein
MHGPLNVKLTTFLCRLSRNLGASISSNPQGLSKPVMGLLYFTFTVKIKKSLIIKNVLTSS